MVIQIGGGQWKYKRRVGQIQGYANAITGLPTSEEGISRSHSDSQRGLGGQGVLGLSIRYCSFKGASENVWHILDVIPGCAVPAAGLQPFSDYVIGTDAIFNDVSFHMLQDLLSAFL